MVKKKDLLKIFFIYICLCHPSPAHPCGDNPLRNLMFISERTGRSFQSVLSILRDLDSAAYKYLQRLFSNYAACVGMVDTGYFKRTGNSGQVKPVDGLNTKLGNMNLQDIVTLINSMDSGHRYSKQSPRQTMLQQILRQTRDLMHGDQFHQPEVLESSDRK